MAKEQKIEAPAEASGYRKVVVMLENGMWLAPEGEEAPRRFGKGDLVTIKADLAAELHKTRAVTPV
jgi:hypothetical protein